VSSQTPFRPLVVGAPRSGFALLCSVVIHFVPMAPPKADLRQRLLNALVTGLGDHVCAAIVAEFERRGITEDLIYNPNFRLIQGGPKWLRDDKPGLAAFRKYIGVRGKGDFTLNTSHPREVLDVDAVVHSHTDPGVWSLHPAYAAYVKYASVRDPVGILNSSVHSLNALASEYIQRFVPPDQDDDRIRQALALYKLTDLDFMDGLVRFLVGYLEEFVKHVGRYHVMKWEDLILTPVPTIRGLADAAGLPMTDEHAGQIWARLDHVNLTGHHRHNFRAGKGIVGDWRSSLTNEHLALFRSHGLERFTERLGYGPIDDLDEKAYTPFQVRVREHLSRGEVYRAFSDQDLFGFAFNKSNIVSDRFVFRRSAWREWTQIERSAFADAALEQAVWDTAEAATGRLNALLLDFLESDVEGEGQARRVLLGLRTRHRATLGRLDPRRYDTAFDLALAELDRATGRGSSVSVPGLESPDTPLLVETIDGYNVVVFRGTYYGLPHALGEIRLDEEPEPSNPSILTDASLEHLRMRIRRPEAEA
jgi:hypothetical protein